MAQAVITLLLGKEARLLRKREGPKLQVDSQTDCCLMFNFSSISAIKAEMSFWPFFAFYSIVLAHTVPAFANDDEISVLYSYFEGKWFNSFSEVCLQILRLQTNTKCSCCNCRGYCSVTVMLE